MVKTVQKPSFTKEQFINSKNSVYIKDLLSALLEDGKTYTHDEVKNIVEKYLKKVVED